ncbi:hypothetical protein VNO77_36628 [Canavalia gladiata]|uniref:Uncharacterized protein n=1 Tax=Canavalia gladiata TaxID=3824 RepID=A0AAN9K9Z4_CANGL
MVAGFLRFVWAILAALGLSNLCYSEAGSSRNIIIVGLSLFFSLSIPAYFQKYGISPDSNLSVPCYLQPCIVASHGPFHTKYGGICIWLMQEAPGQPPYTDPASLMETWPAHMKSETLLPMLTHPPLMMSLGLGVLGGGLFTLQPEMLGFVAMAA